MQVYYFIPREKSDLSGGQGILYVKQGVLHFLIITPITTGISTPNCKTPTSTKESLCISAYLAVETSPCFCNLPSLEVEVYTFIGSTGTFFNNHYEKSDPLTQMMGTVKQLILNSLWIAAWNIFALDCKGRDLNTSTTPCSNLCQWNHPHHVPYLFLGLVTKELQSFIMAFQNLHKTIMEMVLNLDTVWRSSNFTATSSHSILAVLLTFCPCPFGYKPSKTGICLAPQGETELLHRYNPFILQHNYSPQVFHSTNFI